MSRCVLREYIINSIDSLFSLCEHCLEVVNHDEDYDNQHSNDQDTDE